MAPEIPILQFKHHIHSSHGWNMTTRLGTKWSERVNPGDIIDLAETDKEPDLKARVVGVLVGPLYRVACDHLIKYQHDPETRTMGGLLLAMDAAYGRRIRVDETVTLVLYTLVP